MVRLRGTLQSDRYLQSAKPNTHLYKKIHQSQSALAAKLLTRHLKITRAKIHFISCGFDTNSSEKEENRDDSTANYPTSDTYSEIDVKNVQE